MSAAVSQDKFFYGGQAVLEGVMMRGRTTYAVAVRKPDGEIQVLRERLLSIIYTHPIWKLPLLRGLAGLWEQLHLGMKALMWSANIQAAAEQVELSATTIRVTMAIAVAGALLFFLGVPLLAAGFLSRGRSNLFFGVVDGAVRIALLLLYLYAISFKAEIARLFAYHGAEHKTINAYEAGLPLDVPNVRTQSTLVMVDDPRAENAEMAIASIATSEARGATYRSSDGAGFMPMSPVDVGLRRSWPPLRPRVISC